jgi:WD40 repeat protein
MPFPKTLLILSLSLGFYLPGIQKIDHGRHYKNPIDFANSISFSPDGSRLLLACDDSTARILDATNGNILSTLRGHLGRVTTAEYSPDGKLIATTSRDKTMKVWNALTGILVSSFNDKVFGITKAKFSPDSKRLLATYGNKIDIRKVEGFALEQTITGEQLFIDACFSADSKFIFSASTDKTVKKWVIGFDQPLLTMARHKEWVHSVSASADGKYLISSSLTENAIYVWDAKQGYLICTVPIKPGVRGLQCSNLNNYFYADQHVKIGMIGFADCKLLYDEISDYDDMFTVSALSPDGGKIVTLSISGTLRFWDAATGTILKTLN